jgi:hypothetical protein
MGDPNERKKSRSDDLRRRVRRRQLMSAWLGSRRDISWIELAIERDPALVIAGRMGDDHGVSPKCCLRAHYRDAVSGRW